MGAPGRTAGWGEGALMRPVYVALLLGLLMGFLMGVIS